MRIRSFFLSILLSVVFAFPAFATDLTDYFENELIDYYNRGGTGNAPSTWYVGLMTAATACDAGTVTEVTGGSYARVSVANSSAQWDAAGGSTDGTTANTNAITFPTPSADWGQVTHFGLWDASSSGNLWVCSALTASKNINDGDPAPSFAAGALTIQYDN
jgi:hypothetical protein